MRLVSADPGVFCIDEPELHLHPAVQRNFLKFISDSTEHQYFISTHSNSFLDYEIEDKKIYHVRLENGSTKISECKNVGNSRLILDDLGIRASEILQSNGIIWVEGASDRIYIKRWLELTHPELKEGLNYTFQYYNGKNLSHYSLQDEEFKELLNVLFINRNGFFVIDSDMKQDYLDSDLRDTKQRIIEECKKRNFSYWVTAGREIENYITDDALGRFCGEKIQRKQFERISEYCGKYKTLTKVKFARGIAPMVALDDIKNNLDLENKIELLAQEIKNWNS